TPGCHGVAFRYLTASKLGSTSAPAIHDEEPPRDPLERAGLGPERAGGGRRGLRARAAAPWRARQGGPLSTGGAPGASIVRAAAAAQAVLPCTPPPDVHTLSWPFSGRTRLLGGRS